MNLHLFGDDITDLPPPYMELPICSVSGGKDSTALYCLMIEYFGQNFLPIFANTGHEHPVTLNYVRNLHLMAGGPPVVEVHADFTKVLAKKRRQKEAETRGMILNTDSVKIIRDHWRDSQRYRPTGNAFADMMLWKGRAPSTKAQFCTEHLKLWPIKFYLDRNFPGRKYVMFTGIRAGESKNRAKKQPFGINDFYDCDQVLPLLYEDEQQVFDFLRQKGVPPNPLYALGYGRVGCFPCIHANKNELNLLPDWAWDRLEYYESLLQRSWFPAGILPGSDGQIPKIPDVRLWCRTSHGGRQFNLFRQAPDDAPSCMSGWVCE